MYVAVVGDNLPQCRCSFPPRGNRNGNGDGGSISKTPRRMLHLGNPLPGWPHGHGLES